MNSTKLELLKTASVCMIQMLHLLKGLLLFNRVTPFRWYLDIPKAKTACLKDHWIIILTVADLLF